MGLTAEQQKMIEENKRKALERRAAKQVDPTTSKILGSPAVKKTPMFKNSPSTGLNQKPKGTPLQNKGSLAKPLSSPKNQRPLVTFQLISRVRFTVEAPFDNEMVEMFKKIPSKAYDGVNRKWTFGLADHQRLFEGLNPLLAKYQIQPLPKYVLDTFR